MHWIIIIKERTTNLHRFLFALCLFTLHYSDHRGFSCFPIVEEGFGRIGLRWDWHRPEERRGHHPDHGHHSHDVDSDLKT